MLKTTEREEIHFHFAVPIPVLILGFHSKSSSPLREEA